MSAARPVATADAPRARFVTEVSAEIGLIERALRQGHAPAVAAAAGRLARAGGPAGAARVASIAADLETRALAGDLAIAAHLVASIEQALMTAAAAPARRDADSKPPLPTGAVRAPAPDDCAAVAPPPAAGDGAALPPAAMLGAAALGFAILTVRAFSPGHVGAGVAAVAVALSAAALARLGRAVADSARVTTALGRSRDVIAAAERRQRLLFERSPQPMWVYDRATLRILAVNDSAVAVYGYSRDEFLAMSADAMRPPEEVDSLIAHLREVSGAGRLGTSPTRPWRHRYKDGTVVDVEIASDDVVLDGRECRIVLCRDTTERNAASLELADAHAAAREASRMQSAFLANLSHEIRTPMNGVLGMNELLLATDLDEEQRFLAEQVSGSGAQMLSIIDDILDLSTIEAGRLELREGDVELERMADEVCRAASPQADAKGLELRRRIGDGVPHVVRGDGERIRRVLSSLVSNAIKFTPAGTVVVRVDARPARSAHAARIRVEVTDTGIGIEPRALDRMFEPFTQADASPSRGYGGVGLGLAIARDLVELMGGTIGARSEPGRGSAFWFELALEVPRRPRMRTDETAPRADWLREPVSGRGAPLVLVADSGPAVLVRHRSDRRGERPRADRAVRERPGALGRFGRTLAEVGAGDRERGGDPVRP